MTSTTGAQRRQRKQLRRAEMSKARNRISFSPRYNQNEINFIVSAMSLINISDMKNYIKFASLKMAEIIQQQEAKRQKDLQEVAEKQKAHLEEGKQQQVHSEKEESKNE